MVERADVAAVDGKKKSGDIAVHMPLILPPTVASLTAQHATVCGQVLFSVAEQGLTMVSKMEIQPLFSRLTCHENSVFILSDIKRRVTVCEIHPAFQMETW